MNDTCTTFKNIFNRIGSMVNGSSVPVVAGLAIGIAFIVLFSVVLKPDFILTDQELISKYGKLSEVKYFREKYPDAKAEVNRNPNEESLRVSFSFERQAQPPTDWYSGINTFGITVYSEPNHLSLATSCAASQGVTIEMGFDNITSIDEAEKNCFHTASTGTGIFEPDNSGAELNDEVYQFCCEHLE
jgi:hypothetical protein